MKNLFLIITFLYSFLIPGINSYAQQLNPEIKAYQGLIRIEDDQRNFYLEFIQNAAVQIRYTIEKTGRYSIPLKNVSYDETTQAFSGELTFFGNDLQGMVKGKIQGKKIEGEISLHHKKTAFLLNESTIKHPYKEKEIKFSNNDINLSGRLIIPTIPQKNYPVVIFIHGSGYFEKWWGMYWAKEFAKAGVVSFIFDKRGCGASTGNWVQASLNDLASDVSAGIKVLKSFSFVDQKKIGLYAVSQGGWVTSKLASMTKDISFAIVNSGGGISPYEEELFSYQTQLKHVGIKDNDLDKAMDLVKKYMNYLKTGKNRNEIAEEIKVNKDEKWVQALNLKQVLVSEKNRKYWKWVATYNPEKDIKKMKFPLLLLFGKQDYIQPSERSIKAWEDALKKGNNKNYTIHLFQEAGHGLAIGGHHAKGFPSYAKDHIKIMKAWIDSNVIKKDSKEIDNH